MPFPPVAGSTCRTSAVRRRNGVPAHGHHERGRIKETIGAPPRKKASRCSAGVSCPATLADRRAGRRVMPSFEQLFLTTASSAHTGPLQTGPQPRLERTGGHSDCGSGSKPAHDLLPVAVPPLPLTRAWSPPPIRAVLPRPLRRAFRLQAGHRCALPLLHEHVPVLAAGATVPAHLAQRRDQHRAGQPELDAGQADRSSTRT